MVLCDSSFYTLQPSKCYNHHAITIWFCLLEHTNPYTPTTLEKQFEDVAEMQAIFHDHRPPISRHYHQRLVTQRPRQIDASKAYLQLPGPYVTYPTATDCALRVPSLRRGGGECGVVELRRDPGHECNESDVASEHTRGREQQGGAVARGGRHGAQQHRHENERDVLHLKDEWREWDGGSSRLEGQTTWGAGSHWVKINLNEKNGQVKAGKSGDG
eukprot:4033269-Pleurochrysis_carterae.AAC.1